MPKTCALTLVLVAFVAAVLVAPAGAAKKCDSNRELGRDRLVLN
jgi:hypothetical protein